MEQNNESLPAPGASSPENAALAAAERVEQPRPTQEQAALKESREQMPGTAVGDNPPAAQPVADPAQLAAPAAPLPPVISQSGSIMNDNPLVADDVDVIEKEWVVRTKKILEDTRDDPHQKEQEVSRLQADYLQKRFGVQVKMPQG